MGNKDFTCTCDSKDLLLRVVQESKYSQRGKDEREREHKKRLNLRPSVSLYVFCVSLQARSRSQASPSIKTQQIARASANEIGTEHEIQ